MRKKGSQKNRCSVAKTTLTPKQKMQKIVRLAKPDVSVHQLLVKFAKWCDSYGIDVLQEDLKGQNFKTFLAEITNNYEAVRDRVKKLLPYTKPDDKKVMDACDQSYYNFGWNETILYVARTGKIPRTTKHMMHSKTYRNGWHDAKEKMRKVLKLS